MDFLESLELLGYITAFWLFLFWPAYRRRVTAEFRQGRMGRRSYMVFEGVIATCCGQLPVAAIWWTLLG